MNTKIFPALIAAFALISAPITAQNAPSGATRVQGTPDGYGNPVQVTIVAADGSDVSGQPVSGTVGIDQTTPGTTNGVVPKGNVAAGAADSGNPVKVGGVYNSSLPTLTAGQRGDLQQGSRGSLRVEVMGSGSSTTMTAIPTNADANAVVANGAWGANYVFNGTTLDRMRGDTTGTFAVGNAASAATDAGNPVKVGCKMNTTKPTFTDGQRADMQCDTRGNLWVSITGGVITGADGQSNASLASLSSSGGATMLGLPVMGNVFNGSTWDRQRGDTTGTYGVAKPVTSGGFSIARFIAATNGVVKASAGQLYACTLTNSNAAIRYLQIYNKTTAGTLSTDTPVATIPLPPNASVFWGADAIGAAFATGISWQFTTDDIAIPTTAGAATDIHGSCLYK
jgi:hypothetical protein